MEFLCSSSQFLASSPPRKGKVYIYVTKTLSESKPVCVFGEEWEGKDFLFKFLVKLTGLHKIWCELYHLCSNPDKILFSAIRKKKHGGHANL
jgi:hypothetical protein